MRKNSSDIPVAVSLPTKVQNISNEAPVSLSFYIPQVNSADNNYNNDGNDHNLDSLIKGNDIAKNNTVQWNSQNNLADLLHVVPNKILQQEKTKNKKQMKKGKKIGFVINFMKSVCTMLEINWMN